MKNSKRNLIIRGLVVFAYTFLIWAIVVFASGCASYKIGTMSKDKKPTRRTVISLVAKPQINHIDLMVSFLVVITIIVFGVNNRTPP